MGDAPGDEDILVGEGDGRPPVQLGGHGLKHGGSIPVDPVGGTETPQHAGSAADALQRTEEESVDLFFVHHHRDAAEPFDLFIDGAVGEGAPGLAENLRQFVQLGGFEGSRITNIDVHGPTFWRGRPT